jgi:dTMP kinase
MDHLKKEGGILERLASGEHVICLRYYLSSFAYQSLHTDLEWLRAINAKCHQPDLTLFIDTPVGACLESLVESNSYTADELEQEHKKLEEVRENYRTAIEVLRQQGEKIVVIEGNRPPAAIESNVKKHVISLMG